MSCYYYVETKPNKESRIRCLCIECKKKLYPKEKMMCHYGEFGNFDVKCAACEVLIHEKKENK